MGERCASTPWPGVWLIESLTKAFSPTIALMWHSRSMKTLIRSSAESNCGFVIFVAAHPAVTLHSKQRPIEGDALMLGFSLRLGVLLSLGLTRSETVLCRIGRECRNGSFLSFS